MADLQEKRTPSRVEQSDSRSEWERAESDQALLGTAASEAGHDDSEDGAGGSDWGNQTDGQHGERDKIVHRGLLHHPIGCPGDSCRGGPSNLASQAVGTGVRLLKNGLNEDV